MNKKGISIIEFIAFLIIVVVLIIVLLPKTTEKVDLTKKDDYVKEVRNIVDQARIMYQDSNYVNNTNYFTIKDANTKFIKLGNIIGVSDYVDPFGYLYDKDDTKITFFTNGNNIDVIIDVKSCSTNKSKGIVDCYEIVSENIDNLTVNSVKNTVR